MSGFYKWGVHDFVAIPAYELKSGDEMAHSYGGGLRYGGDWEYGAIPIEDVTVVWGELVLLQYTLPVGALAQSKTALRIAVFWQGERPLIQVSQDVPFSARVLVRRK